MYLNVSLCALVLLLSTKAIAWGEHGHRTVAYLARMYFTDQGEALFDELVEPTDTFDISDGAVWADNHSVQGKMPWSKPLHYIDAKDNPPETCGITYRRDCDKDRKCIVAAIVNMTSQVNDPDLSKEQQNIAFKFLLHFLGDITQPLHTEDKCKGGNNLMVQWGKPNTREEKLHAVWDTLIVQKMIGYKRPDHADPDNSYDKKLAQGWAEELKDNIDEGTVDVSGECIDIRKAEKCALKWAGEANAFICSYVLKDGKNLGPDRGDDDCQWEWHGPADVSKEYYVGAVPIVTDQVAKAGWRLAAWVNALAEQREAMKRDGVAFDDGVFKIQEQLEL